jgi:hypothetical protein
MKGRLMRTTLSRAAASAAAFACAVAVSATGLAGTAATAAAATATSSANAVPGPGDGQFTLAPAPGANGEPRPYFMMTIAPGRSAEDIIVFGNNGPAEEEFRVGVSDGETAGNSGSAYGGVTGRCAGPACWLAGLPATVTLAPHSQEEVRFQVAVPANAHFEQYLAGITATPAQTPKPVTLRAKGNSSTKVIIVSRVIIGVAITVGSLTALDTKVKVTGVTATWIDGASRLSVDVRNVGQRFAKGVGDVTCAVDGVKHTYPVTMNTVLPGDAAALQVNGNGMQSGDWPCAVRISGSGGLAVTWSGDVIIPAATAGATKRIAPNDYVVPSEPGIPIWAIVLMVLGGFILFSIWALILRRNHDKNLGKPTDP